MKPICDTKIEIHVSNPNIVTMFTLSNQQKRTRNIQIFEYCCRCLNNIHVGKAAERRADGKGYDWNTSPVGLCNDRGR